MKTYEIDSLHYKRCPVPCLPLKWGRVDAETCLDEPALPSATMNSSAMFSYFQREFGFNKTQVSTQTWPLLFSLQFPTDKDFRQ